MCVMFLLGSPAQSIPQGNKQQYQRSFSQGTPPMGASPGMSGLPAGVSPIVLLHPGTLLTTIPNIVSVFLLTLMEMPLEFTTTSYMHFLYFFRLVL